MAIAPRSAAASPRADLFDSICTLIIIAPSGEATGIDLVAGCCWLLVRARLPGRSLSGAPQGRGCRRRADDKLGRQIDAFFTGRGAAKDIEQDVGGRTHR